MLLRWPLSYELQFKIWSKRKMMVLFVDSDRDDVVLAEKKKEKVKRFYWLLNHLAFWKAKITTVLVFSASIGHWEQNDISKLGHHIWTQPAAQAEVVRQGILGPEFSPGWREHSRHCRGAENDWKLRSPVHGKWPFFGKTSQSTAYWLPLGGIMKLRHSTFWSIVLVINWIHWKPGS